MPRILVGLIVPVAIGWAQIASPPEFREPGTFQRGTSAATVDGTSHASPQRAEVNHELVTRLRALPNLREGLRLRLSEAVNLFLKDKMDASAELLCTLAAEHPGNRTLLPFLGETAGASKVWSGRMLAAVRSLSSHPTSEGEYYLGHTLLKQVPPQTSEALVHLQRSVDLDSKGTRALLELARQHTLAERRAAAIGALEEALRRNDSLAPAHYRLSQLYRSEGQPDRSKVHLRRYQELSAKTEP